jgi:hypothetical protein
LTFFETDQGNLHLGRIAALLFTVALVPGCEYFARIDPICMMHIVFAIGGWLAMGRKKPARTFADSHPLGIVGWFLLFIGLAGQFFFTREH